MTIRARFRPLALTALLALAATGCSSGSGGGSDAGGTLTVWLAVDAQESWPELVQSTNDRFAKAHPGVKVEVQYQQWTTKNQKLDAVLAGKNVPDVVEMGNSETTNYIVNGAFSALDPAGYEQSDAWLPALADACRANGKTYCVPYYVGARVGIYRTDYLAEAGVTGAPKTYPELLSALDRLKATYGAKDPNFSALYLPGRYWYAAMAFVKDAGGEIAVKDGDRWKASLSSPKSVAGLTEWKRLIDTYYVGDRAKDNGDQPGVVAQGRVGVFYGNTWEADSAADPLSGGDPKLKDKFATFPFPGPSGKLLPPFLGGSTLAVPAKSTRKQLAADWIKLFTDRQSQQALIAANTLPNNTAQLAEVAAGGINGPAAQAAATGGWMTPFAPGWTSVEKSNVLPEMLERIANGKASVQDATAEADKRIDEVINER
ncbi:extracellular solute-binding protein [Kitasatospora sp. CB01950]|uniref:extracellular solute-binding protein n=1 Tax=Kitasatospora sp. CB01950 TaxID=1703930 RepID=UPI00093EEE31|nr:extracellular solute-binding protein [Kitasatospora sp. CB01950]OKJ09225.1 sugar ABC transporter substrate-binding protein [Kitasatospora sp. CB01950]